MNDLDELDHIPFFIVWVLLTGALVWISWILFHPIAPQPCEYYSDTRWSDIPARCLDYYIKK